MFVFDLNEIFGQSSVRIDGPGVIDVDYEDVTPPKEPTPEVIEDWTNGNPNKPNP